MKLLAEVEQWIAAATERFGDPALATGNVFARYVPRLPQMPPADVIVTYEQESLLITLEPGTVWPIKVDVDGLLIDEHTGQLVAFGLDKISDGLWTLSPSLKIPGVIHAFVTLYDVPVVAPWESRIIVVQSIGKV